MGKKMSKLWTQDTPWAPFCYALLKILMTIGCVYWLAWGVKEENWFCVVAAALCMVVFAVDVIRLLHQAKTHSCRKENKA